MKRYESITAEVLDAEQSAQPKRKRTAHTERNSHASAPASDTTPSLNGKPRPMVMVDVDEHRVNAEAAAALAGDPLLYQRAASLVRIVIDERESTERESTGIRRPRAPRIDVLARPLVREALARNISWQRFGEDESIVPAHPPGWCCSAVAAYGSWPGVRYLDGITDYPVLRPDGTVLETPGYDAGTALYLAWDGGALNIGNTHAAAIAAKDRLLDVVSDFPFAAPCHQSAWLAGLLTPLARYSFHGPAPLALIDSNTRGAGKGLLASVVSTTVTGNDFTIATYTRDDDEMRKRVTSLVLYGDRLVLLDNISGKLGSPVLDAVLTSTHWSDRLLGANRMMDGPLSICWFATGNNVAVAADTARRTMHVRLETAEEHPEKRSGFKHPRLLAHVKEHRRELLAAALTILRAYCAAGRPDMQLPSWGTYEAWSDLVRSAVVWVGLVDPAESRELLQATADTTAEAMSVILSGLHGHPVNHLGFTAAQLAALLNDATNTDDAVDEIKAAFATLCERLDARSIGYALRSVHRRVIGGMMLDYTESGGRTRRWKVSAIFSASQTSSSSSPLSLPESDNGDNSDNVSPPEKNHAGDGWGPYREGY